MYTGRGLAEARFLWMALKCYSAKGIHLRTNRPGVSSTLRICTITDAVAGFIDVLSIAPAIMRQIKNLGEFEPVPLDLKSTINLPKTGFPMKANLPQNEPKTLARWTEMRLYERIRQARKGSQPYILHDGPPYANGPIHLGHALNKCLKDFVVKSKSMAGFD
ncbi:MAG TPA: class I tRNA ligase family protein, partial [Terriglobales bacterium]